MKPGIPFKDRYCCDERHCFFARVNSLAAFVIVPPQEHKVNDRKCSATENGLFMQAYATLLTIHSFFVIIKYFAYF